MLRRIERLRVGTSSGSYVPSLVTGVEAVVRLARHRRRPFLPKSVDSFRTLAHAAYSVRLTTLSESSGAGSSKLFRPCDTKASGARKRRGHNLPNQPRPRHFQPVSLSSAAHDPSKNKRHCGRNKANRIAQDVLTEDERQSADAAAVVDKTIPSAATDAACC